MRSRVDYNGAAQLRDGGAYSMLRIYRSEIKLQENDIFIAMSDGGGALAKRSGRRRVLLRSWRPCACWMPAKTLATTRRGAWL